uniref:Uncharacterized protein n=1 Tax=Anguilla anguilla TaxID=7936 RepID=A0A0E9X7I5_ANGAN
MLVFLFSIFEFFYYCSLWPFACSCLFLLLKSLFYLPFEFPFYSALGSNPSKP